MDQYTDIRDLDLKDAAKAGGAIAFLTLGVLAPAAAVVWIGHKITSPRKEKR